MEYFCSDLTATAKLLKINRNTINAYFKEFRIKIHNKEFGEFELDESYFGSKRVRGKRGRGAAGKTPVFAMLQRDGKDFVSVFSNGSKDSLMPIIQGKILDRVFHSKDEFARGKFFCATTKRI